MSSIARSMKERVFLLVVSGVLSGCAIGRGREEVSHGPISHPESAEQVEFCPVSGEQVEADQPGVIAYVYRGKTYLFQSEECLEAFKANPELYISQL